MSRVWRSLGQVQLAGPSRWASGFAKEGRRPAVTIPKSRLEEFLRAEVGYLKGTYTDIKIEQILERRTPRDVARLIRKELPPRFATRVKDIEAIDGWEEIPSLVDVHDMLYTSFKYLRMSPIDDDTPLESFTDIIHDLRIRHRPIVALLAESGHRLAELGKMDDDYFQWWINRFMRSRVGTEMLTHHYADLLTNTQDESIVGIVDPRCNPSDICEQAIEGVRRTFATPQDLEIRLEVEQTDIEFSFIPKYLLYIVVELLKNSTIATLRRSERDGAKMRPIIVRLCADSSHVLIQVEDKGGGVPFDLGSKIWLYGFSTTPAAMQSRFQENVLSGPGFGLPMSKLYSEYLGGSLHLMSLPGIGADAYVYLDRIDPGSIAGAKALRPD